jgi:hypothetical protein
VPADTVDETWLLVGGTDDCWLLVESVDDSWLLAESVDDSWLLVDSVGSTVLLLECIVVSWLLLGRTELSLTEDDDEDEGWVVEDSDPEVEEGSEAVDVVCKVEDCSEVVERAREVEEMSVPEEKIDELPRVEEIPVVSSEFCDVEELMPLEVTDESSPVALLDDETPRVLSVELDTDPPPLEADCPAPEPEDTLPVIVDVSTLLLGTVLDCEFPPDWALLGRLVDDPCQPL